VLHCFLANKVVALGTISYGIFMIINGYYYSFEEGEEKEEK
jgi:hypothetical protein